MFKWPVVANMTSNLGYTASSLGNHEFDDGVSDLEAYARATQLSYRLLACNLDLNLVPQLRGYIEPSFVTHVDGNTIETSPYQDSDFDRIFYRPQGGHHWLRDARHQRAFRHRESGILGRGREPQEGGREAEAAERRDHDRRRSFGL